MKNNRFLPVFILGLVVMAGCLAGVLATGGAISARQASAQNVDAALAALAPRVFTNPAVGRAPITGPPQEASGDSFTSPEGIAFNSYAEAWDLPKLEALYEELLKNRHGEELHTLHEVNVYPEVTSEAVGDYHGDVQIASLHLNFGALPPGLSVAIPLSEGVINLHGGNTYTTVESMARTLSHEYGHLYTYYYMFNTDEDNLGGTEYARLRGAAANGLLTDAAPDYSSPHHLYLVEAAAEDYVQLMGSPTTRQVARFVDIRQKNSGMEDSDEITRITAGNPQPQENQNIPLAAEVPGLADYFYSFIGQAAPPAAPREEIDLEISQSTARHDSTSGLLTFTAYNISWNTPYQNAIYTLICYEPGAEEYNGYAVKTVMPGETPTATVGTASYESSTMIHWTSDELDRGTKVFLVYVQLEDGTYYKSNPMEYTFPRA